TVALDPARLGRPYLMRSDLAVLQIIKDELGKRPIYFSTSTGNYADQLGLSSYLVGEGLVRRLVPRPVAAGDGVWRVEGRGFVDVPRSAALLFGVYRGGETAARPRPRGWVDVPSQNSLLGYVFAYDTIAQALRETDPARADRAVALRDAILANTTYAPAGGRDAHQPAGGVHERDRGGMLVPGERALDAGVGTRPPAAPPRGGRGGARGRHGVHRLEPVGGEREGLHAVVALDRAGAVA